VHAAQTCHTLSRELPIVDTTTEMATANITYELPPLPDYTLQPLPRLVSCMPDAYLSLAIAVIAYWAVSGIFHVIDEYDLFPQYRLHTPAEILKRNHVTRWEVLRDVVIQQIIQTIFGIAMDLLDDEPTMGKDDYNVAWYAQKIRLAQRAIPFIIATVGLNPSALASKISDSQPMLAAAIAGGRYQNLVQTATIGGQEAFVPAFALWELLVAKFVYWYGIPAFQFMLGICIVDTWEYFLHRAMHMNRWLYGMLITPQNLKARI
jgi:sphinganine C4-monooxygenase